MKYLITGGAGFIGSHLVNNLVHEHEIIVIDNLSEGTEDNISQHIERDNFKFVKADLRDSNSFEQLLEGVDVVFHLAAHRDVRRGVERPDIDIDNGILATFNLLEVMRKQNVKKIIFSSSQVVYGEPTIFPVDESYGPLLPISIYGASKLSCESLIMSYSHTFEMQSWIFRFANIVGPRGTHGVIPDFIEKLKKNKTGLEILGDGKQTKPYMAVGDCVDAILFTLENAREGVNLFNLGTDDWTNVTRIAEIVIEECGLTDVKLVYTGGERGWVGDVPRIKLSVDKIKNLGFEPKHNSEEAVRLAARSLVELLW
ncbi:MAG: NAD-dependent epimerase/dehydratase family protein [Deltaproteobacteria bacterium]|nr:NAD-dependent epimerase/dehydratase family protein [Deltaproteobacteria bacterium]